MPASKVRKKAKDRVAAEKKRLREIDRSCMDACCPRETDARAAGDPPQANAGANVMTRWSR